MKESELYRRPRGLNGMTASEMNDMRRDLLPEGTRVFDDETPERGCMILR